MLELDIKWSPPVGREPCFALDIACSASERIVGVFGPSGAGKTSLLHLIAGILSPDSGRIVVDDACVFDSARGIDLPPHERRVGLVFQDSRLLPHYSVRGNLEYGYRLLPRGERRVRPDEVVDLLALGPLLGRRVRELSGGERQRVALGRALLASPRVLLLDEPLASLDVGLKGRILPFLQRAHALGIGIVYVSHDIGEILQLTNDLLVVEAGRLLGHGAFHEIISDPKVFNLARGLGLQNVLRAAVAEHSPARGLTTLRLAGDAGAVIVGPPVNAAARTTVHLSVRPEDIALALAPVTGISIQNQIAGRIVKSSTVQGRVLLEVDIGETLLAEVSPKSFAEMRLAPGGRVYCLFKAQAVRYLGY